MLCITPAIEITNLAEEQHPDTLWPQEDDRSTVVASHTPIVRLHKSVGVQHWTTPSLTDWYTTTFRLSSLVTSSGISRTILDLKKTPSLRSELKNSPCEFPPVIYGGRPIQEGLQPASCGLHGYTRNRWPRNAEIGGRDPPFPMAYSCRNMHSIASGIGGSAFVTRITIVITSSR